jgi:hypothetical protein
MGAEEDCQPAARRLGDVPVSLPTLGLLLRLPNGVRVVGVVNDYEGGGVMLRVEGRNLPPVREGERVPRMKVRWAFARDRPTAELD